MISFNTPYISQQPHTGILINRHLTVQAAADVTGYNIQYLRRLLRSGTLEGIKIGQMRLIDLEALDAYLQHVENTSDPLLRQDYYQGIATLDPTSENLSTSLLGSSHQNTLRQLVKELKSPGLVQSRHDKILDQMQRLFETDD